MIKSFRIDKKDFNGAVLVTGAAGCIGSWVLSLLIKNKIPVVAFDLSKDKRRLKLLINDENISKIKWITGDISDYDTIEKIFKNNNIQSIIHLAALQVPFCAADPVAGAKVNVVGTVNIFESARKANLRRLTYASSVAAHGLLKKSIYKPTLYGAYKLCDENIAFNYFQNSGLPNIGIRPGIVYGIGRDQGMTSKTTISLLAAAACKPYTIPFSGPISALYAGEVASAFIKAVSKDQEGSYVFDMNGTYSNVEKWVEIINKIQPNAKISINGDPLPFPFDFSDKPLRKHIGDYGFVDLEFGMLQTYNAFQELLSKGKITFIG